MYKLIIVDDEDWIRERLVETINWKSVDVEVIGEASDGESAANLIQELRPDIVLTDICMPEINGLSLIDRINKLDYSIKVIIISGYDDFEYAKSAVRLDAYAYLLKPVDDEELLSTVKDAAQSLSAERKKTQLLKSLQQKLVENLPAQREQFMQSLLNGYIKSSKSAEEELVFLGIKNKPLNHICFVIEPDQVFNADELPSEIHLFKFSVANITEDFLKRIGQYTVIISQRDQIICIASSELGKEQLKRRIKSVAYGVSTMVKRLFNKTVTIGIGNICEDLLIIQRSFEEAHRAVAYRDFLGEDSIYNVEKEDKASAPIACKEYDIENLCLHMQNARRREALEAAERILNEFEKQNAKISPIHNKILFIDIVFHIVKSTSNSKSLTEKEDVLNVEFFNELYSLKTIDDLKKHLYKIINTLIDRTEEARDGGKRRIVEMAIDYIEKHYDEPIMLSDVADTLYINPSYFCKVFKIETGDSFVKYLMKYRIEKAKRLLEDPRLKIYEVAEKTGYSDVQYFTKIFKTVTGVVPTYYRDKIK